MKLRVASLIALGVLGTAAGWLCWPDAAPPPSPQARVETRACRLSVGQDLQFELNAITDSAGAVKRHLELEGVLHWHVLSRRSTGWLVAAALDQVVLEQRPEMSLEAQRTAFESPFLIELGRDCRFKGLAFKPRLDVQVRSQLEALVRSMEVVLPIAPVAQWTVRQEDAMGSYQGRYRLDKADGEAVIFRHRTPYFASRLPAGVPAMGAPHIDVVASEMRATLDASGAWVTALSSHDTLRVSLHQQLLAEMKGALEVRRIECAALARLHDLPVADFIFGSGVQPEQAMPEPKAPSVELAAADLKTALSDFRKRLSAGRGGLHDAVATLAGYLVENPEAIAELMRLLRGDALDPKLHSAIFLALERTGTPEAERALSQALGDARLTVVDRMRAAAALGDFPRPTQRTVDALLAQARPGAGPEAREVAQSALLSLGTLAHNSATASPELAERAREELAARLRAPSSPEETIATLDAVGNSGAQALMSSVERYTKDRSAQVRAHAAAAYRNSQGAHEEAQLTSWLRSEPEPSVRRAIVTSLFERSSATRGAAPSSELVSSAVEWLPREEDAQVRRQLIRLLGAASPTAPAAKAALVEQFRREQKPELLELIGRFCSVDDLG